MMEYDSGLKNTSNSGENTHIPP